MARYADRLREPALDGVLRGYLTGSLDLVFRLRDGRFVLADYKTNRLGGREETLTAWHYRPEALQAEMQAAHYPLQALLYTVALHRYLRWRLPGYEPDRHLGGVLYLFVRGMSAVRAAVVDGEPCGVWSWRPPAGLVEALSDLFDRGRRRETRSNDVDAFDAALAPASSGLLREFNRGRGPARRPTSTWPCRLGRLGDSDDESVLLGAAFAVRAPRLGHVCVDLATIRADGEQRHRHAGRPRRRCRGPSPAVVDAAGPRARLVGEDRPLHLEGTTFYLDRLLARRAPGGARPAWRGPRAGRRRRPRAAGRRAGDGSSPERRRPGPAAPGGRRRRAAAAVGHGRGPGTGKTTTVARVLALLDEQAVAAGARPPLIALAAPTGKAAARLEEAVRAEADACRSTTRSGRGCAPCGRARSTACSGSTRATAAGSATTAATGCPTTWSWSTRPPWSRCR